LTKRKGFDIIVKRSRETAKRKRRTRRERSGEETMRKRCGEEVEASRSQSRNREKCEAESLKQTRLKIPDSKGWRRERDGPWKLNNEEIDIPVIRLRVEVLIKLK